MNIPNETFFKYVICNENYFLFWENLLGLYASRKRVMVTILLVQVQRRSKIMMAIKHMMYYFGLGMNNDGKNIKNSLKCTQCRKRLIMRLSGKLQSTHAQNKLSCTKNNHLRKVRLMV